MYIIVGLGNPGEEYKNTRHNTGRIIASELVKNFEMDDFKFDKMKESLVSKGEVGDEKVVVILPETFMNKSGKAVSCYINGEKSAMEKKASKLIVIQDDIDLPIGNVKMVFNRGSGGHKGVESIKKAIKTEAFYRIKVGVIPTTSTGKLRKPDAGEKIVDFILSNFKDDELKEIKKVGKKIKEGLQVLFEGGGSAKEKKLAVAKCIEHINRA